MSLEVLRSTLSREGFDQRSKASSSLQMNERSTESTVRTIKGGPANFINPKKTSFKQKDTFTKKKV